MDVTNAVAETEKMEAVLVQTFTDTNDKTLSAAKENQSTDEENQSADEEGEGESEIMM